jgi:hypothetical protein
MYIHICITQVSKRAKKRGLPQLDDDDNDDNNDDNNDNDNDDNDTYIQHRSVKGLRREVSLN